MKGILILLAIIGGFALAVIAVLLLLAWCISRNDIAFTWSDDEDCGPNHNENVDENENN